MPLNVHWFVEPPISVLARARRDTTTPYSVNGIPTRSSDEQFQALMNGTADAVVTAMDNVMDWNMRPGAGDFRIIAQVERTTLLSLVARSSINDIKSLKDGILLVDAPANGFVVAARALLDDLGLPNASYTLKPAGGVRERCETLIAGGGDATLLGPPFDDIAVVQGARVLARVNDRYPAFPGQGLVVRQSAHDRARTAITTWLRIMENAREWARTTKDAAIAHLGEAGVPGHAANTILDLIPDSLVPDKDGLGLLIAQRARADLRGADVTYSDLVDASFIETITSSRVRRS